MQYANPRRKMSKIEVSRAFMGPVLITVLLLMQSQNLPLTSKQKFRFGLARQGQSATFKLKSTGGFGQRDGSPCTTPRSLEFILTWRN